ncbi:HAD-IA family hydrolase [Micromonospora sp. NPDC005652]|uniref:HAD-IA family hydrolase n=1 Tax=Micromonospora sp. NPDC005652 TaxID=3157046 RepID=UPI0033D8CCCD
MSGKRTHLTTIDAVLFDMDGTLVNSDAAVERAWMAWAGEFSVDPAAVLAIAHGTSALHTIRQLLPQADAATVAAAAARQLALQYDDLADVVALRGAEELLGLLRRCGLPWAVVTGADAPLAKARLSAAGIRAPVLLTVDDVTAGKPDPEGYLLAARQLGVNIARCLVVEDAEAGVAAGRAAGAMVAALKGVPADLAIQDLGDLARQLPGLAEVVR